MKSLAVGWLPTANCFWDQFKKRNFDYLSQLYSTGYYNDFFRLTRNYEYTWYGKFNVNPEAFGIIKTEFENFYRKLS